jgi:hypothetical protein
MKPSARKAIALLAFPLLWGAALLWYMWLALRWPQPPPGSAMTVPNRTGLLLGGILFLAYPAGLLVVAMWRRLRQRKRDIGWAIDATLTGLAAVGLPSGALLPLIDQRLVPWTWWVPSIFFLAAPWFAAIVLARQREFGPWRFAALFGALLVNVAVVAGSVGYFLSPREEASLRLSGRRQLRVFFYPFDTNVLTEDISNTPFLYRGKVLGRNLGGEYGNWLIVRPDGMPYPQKVGSRLRPLQGVLLYRPAAKFVVHAFPYHFYSSPEIGCATNLAYDIETGQCWGFWELPELSPFILIGADDRLNRDDANALLRLYGTGGASQYINTPETETLAKDASNPNPEVRKLVAQMLGQRPLREQFLGDDERKLVQKTLRQMSAQDPDPGVRQVARTALALEQEKHHQ